MTTRTLRLWPCLTTLLTLGLPVLSHAEFRAVPIVLSVPSAAYPTIQSGVDASHDGDTVLVADGTYTGPGNRDIDLLGKSLTVTSLNGPAKTIIDCGGYASTDGSGNHRGFYIHSGEKKATISGFTVKNGYETYISSIPGSGYGGGVYNENISGAGGTIALTNCTITGNTATFGGGVYNYNSSGSGNGTITLTNCTITANTATFGGGVYNYNSSGSGNGTITLTNCTITGNTARDGGGVSNGNDSGGAIIVTNCTIIGNGAQDYDGGGISNYGYSGIITIIDCSINGNIAAEGGGGIYNRIVNGPKQFCIITVTNCAVAGNYAGGGGGGVLNYEDGNGGTTTVTNCTITGNATDFGGGVYNYNGSGACTIILTNDIVYDNSYSYGGEINGSSNEFVSFSDIQGGYYGTSNIKADPQFVNATNGDLHLRPGSPCLGAGTPNGTPATDKDGNMRPNPPSIGAYDSGGARETVLLIHGNWSGEEDAWGTNSKPLAMRLALKRAGYVVQAMNFATEQETTSNETFIELQAQAVARRLKTLQSQSGFKQTSLVCHSMGGLAARYYLEHPKLWPVDEKGVPYSGVNKLIMLGTPNWGTDGAYLDPVAAICAARYLSIPSATDTYDNHWSPAVNELFAEWEACPSRSSNGYYYPDGYKLGKWPASGTGFVTPIQTASYNIASGAAALFILHPFGADYQAVIGVENAFPIDPRARFRRMMTYYPQVAHAQGVFYPAVPNAVEGVNTRLVSRFLLDLNVNRSDNSGAQVYMIAGTEPLALDFSLKSLLTGQTLLFGPFNSDLAHGGIANDGVIPTDSVFGRDPITGSYLYPNATREIVDTYHTDLPNNSMVVDQVVQWLSN